MNIAIYTLTSELHDEQAVSGVTKEFLGTLGVEYELKGNDYTREVLKASSSACCHSCSDSQTVRSTC